MLRKKMSGVWSILITPFTIQPKLIKKKERKYYRKYYRKYLIENKLVFCVTNIYMKKTILAKYHSATNFQSDRTYLCHIRVINLETTLK